MRTEMHKVLNIRNFFKVLDSNEYKAKYILENPSKILVQNIHKEWLRSIWSKTHKHLPVYLNRSRITLTKQVPFGFIGHHVIQPNEHKVWEHNLNNYEPQNRSELKFCLIVPEQDIMQYFVQWQRYRKYWWSSITTTPSLFRIGDIRYGEGTADVNIVAKFPWGEQTVETVTIDSRDMNLKKTSCLHCVTTLEGALFILLLDGLNNNTSEGYLRLHKKMAPFKISFCLDSEASNLNQTTLQDLAKLLHHRLEAKEISTLLPSGTLSLSSQIKENLQMGVAYTAILSELTLVNGIFQLMNSSTMLKEQVHVSDIDSYAAMISGK